MKEQLTQQWEEAYDNMTRAAEDTFQYIQHLDGFNTEVFNNFETAADSAHDHVEHLESFAEQAYLSLGRAAADSSAHMGLGSLTGST